MCLSILEGNGALEEEKAAKGNLTKTLRGGSCLYPKYCCAGKGSVILPSPPFSSHKTRLGHGKVRQGMRRKRKTVVFFVQIKFVPLHFTI